MFIRTKTTPNSPRKSVQIVETYRQGERVKQRIVRHIGIAQSEEELAKLKELATFTMIQMQREVQLGLFSAEEEAEQINAARIAQETEKSIAVEEPLPLDLRQLRETSRITTGFHEVYGVIYRQLGFTRLLGKRKAASAKTLYDTVMARIAKPASKLASADFLRRDFGIEINSDQMYRMMDHLDAAAEEKIQALARSSATSLLGEKIDLIFFDCTTLYFESFDEDHLRQKGFSKDHKTAETQVLFALLVTSAGLPIGYRLYPGKAWEGHVLPDIVADLQRMYPINRVVLVADSAILTKENIGLLQEKEQPYIVAAKIKQLPEPIKEQILDSRNYQKNENGDSWFETEYLGQRLIVTYSEKRARKDAHERAKNLEKAKEQYAGKTAKRAIRGHHARYLKIQGENRIEIDPERVAEIARWDGLHGILTNEKDLKIEEALAHYRGLWQVEETFRLSKHDLRVRPIFHWTEKRIRAHIALCFMALTCIRWLTYTCKLRYKPLSAEVIRNELAHVQTSILEDQKTKHRFAIPSPVTKHAKALFKIVDKSLSNTPFQIR